MHTPAVRRRLSLVLTLTAVLPALVPGRAAAADFQPQIVSSGTYTNIADTTTTAANQTTTLSFLYFPVIGGGNVAFNAYYNAFNGYGIFTGTAGVKGAATIADYTTTATGQTTVFSSFDAPVVSGGNVAFSANYNAGNGQGVFTGTAGVKGAATIADFTTIAANQTTTFYSLSAPVLSGNNVAFRASYNSGGSGIFTGTAGIKGAATIADFTTKATGQTTVFSSFGAPVLSGNNVAFSAAYNASAGRGIFTGTAGVKGAATVADFTTIAANQTTVFSSFGDPVLSGNNVAFNAAYNANAGRGIFTGTVGTKGAATIADYTTKATGQTTVFSTFAAPVLSGNNVAFYANYNAGNGVGIFTGKVGMPGATTIADLTTTAPGRGLFTAFGSQGVAISGNNVAFMGESYVTGSSGATGNGLYLSINGTLTDVAAVGEPLFGSTISELSFFPSGLEGNTVTYGYSLTNGVFGVATATVVPEPSTWALLGVGTAALGLALRRRRVARA